MRFVLAFMILNGVNLTAWGCVGLCRFIHERTSRRWARAVVPMSALLCILSVLFLGPTRRGVVWLADWMNTAGALTFAAASAGALLVVLLRRRERRRAARSSGDGRSPGTRRAGENARARISPDAVAVLVCAHNEAPSLHICLDSAARLVPIHHIFVGSDGSTDDTVAIARSRGCRVLDIQPSGGKARALRTLVEHFDICAHFDAVLILDADAELDAHYLDHGLPLFDDPSVVAVAGHVVPRWHPHLRPRWSMFFNAYRTRLCRITQALLRYGQTWRYTNVSFLVPGFASMYRTRALRNIDVAADGLCVEDVNMTFEVHHKRLGRIAYTPGAFAVSQEANCLIDYLKQVRRWHLGFWQTVRRHGVWASFFWLSLGGFVFEKMIESLACVAVPFVLVALAAGHGTVALWLPVSGVTDVVTRGVVMGVLVADYLLTLVIAFVERKGVLALYGLGFAMLRWLDALIFLCTLPLAFVEHSDGRWVSPARR